MKSRIVIIVLSVLLMLSLAFSAIMVYREFSRSRCGPVFALCQEVNGSASATSPDNNQEAEPSPSTEDSDNGQAVEPSPSMENSNNGQMAEVPEIELAPDFSVRLLTGDTFTLSEHIGSVVVLDFWATWCGPCVRKMPYMQALSEKYEDVLFIGMNVGEDPRHVQNFISEHGFTYPIGLDEGGLIHRTLYPSPGVPFTVIIGANGAIVDTFLGGGAGIVALIESTVSEALG